MNDAEKAYQYFVITVPENEEQAKAYFWARKALQPTLTPPNELLTLEQLRGKVGQPVVIKYSYGGPHTVAIVDVRYVPHLGADKIRLVFWGPCELCGGDKLDGVGVGDHFGLRVYLRGGDKKPPENERFQFCPKCGRPLTPKAWAELEKRLRG